MRSMIYAIRYPVTAFFFVVLIMLSINMKAQEPAFQMPVIQVTNFKKDTFNITKFGAMPDG